MRMGGHAIDLSGHDGVSFHNFTISGFCPAAVDGKGKGDRAEFAEGAELR